MIDTRIGLGKLGPLDTAKIGGDRLAKLWPPAMHLDRPYLDELVMNVTVTEPDTDGFITVYPCDKPRPVASNLNFTKGETIANLVVSRIYGETVLSRWLGVLLLEHSHAPCRRRAGDAQRGRRAPCRDETDTSARHTHRPRAHHEVRFPRFRF